MFAAQSIKSTLADRLKPTFTRFHINYLQLENHKKNHLSSNKMLALLNLDYNVEIVSVSLDGRLTDHTDCFNAALH